jgi:hypothetical protein
VLRNTVSNDRQRSGLPATPGNVLVGTPLGRPLAQGFSIDYERGPATGSGKELREGMMTVPPKGCYMTHFQVESGTSPSQPRGLPL